MHCLCQVYPAVLNLRQFGGPLLLITSCLRGQWSTSPSPPDHIIGLIWYSGVQFNKASTSQFTKTEKNPSVWSPQYSLSPRDLIENRIGRRTSVDSPSDQSPLHTTLLFLLPTLHPNLFLKLSVEYKATIHSAHGHAHILGVGCEWNKFAHCLFH